MFKIAKPLARLIDSFQKLPGIGPKSAQRLAYYLLHVPQVELDSFAQNLSNLKKDTVLCQVCKNVSEANPCEICSDSSRNKSIILVVSDPLDILAFERTIKFNGVYHVLHGVISPLDNIGPDEIYIQDLLSRITSHQSPVTEVIIATNPTMEGDATAMYIAKKIHSLVTNHQPLVTRLGMGVPTGADLGYADENTLTQALDGRREL